VQKKLIASPAPPLFQGGANAAATYAAATYAAAAAAAANAAATYNKTLTNILTFGLKLLI